MDEAEMGLLAAWKADPRLAAAAYNLAVIAAGKEKLDEAILWCRKAYELRPHEAKYGYTLGFYLNQKGDADGSVHVLEQVIRRDPADPSPYALLGEIYQKQGKLDEAKSVYGRAAANEALSPADRQGFEARIRELLRAR
jgi:predicted Zn-dependent protease